MEMLRGQWEKGGHQQRRHRTWETKVEPPAVQAPNLADKSKDITWESMNRNAAWPAEKGGRQQRRAPNLGDKSEEIA